MILRKLLLRKFQLKFLLNFLARKKTALVSALNDGKNIYGLEVGFDLADSPSSSKNMREVLSKSNEIIATLSKSEIQGFRENRFSTYFCKSHERIEQSRNSESSKLK
jgi:hypothetical protein